MLNAILAGLFLFAPLLTHHCALTACCDEKPKGVQVRTVVVVADGEEPTAITVSSEGMPAIVGKCIDLQAATGEALSAGPMVIALAGDDKTTLKAETMVLQMASPKDCGWLGVQVGELPEALAAHLNVEERGVLIVNVVEESPADKAGLQRHDAIIKINDEAVEGDVPLVVKRIGSHNPGEIISLTILRAGKEQTLNVELGQRAAHAYNWKFDFAPLTEFEEQLETRGRVMGRGPGGKWIVKDLGDLDELTELPEEVRILAPHAGSRTMIITDGDQSSISVNVNRDGTSLSVKREDGGPIVVTRTDEKGDETEVSYDSEEELKAGDEEAYEVFKSMGPHGPFRIHLDLDDLSSNLQNLTENLEGLSENLQVELSTEVDKAQDAFKKAMEELAAQMKDSDFQKALKGSLKVPGMPTKDFLLMAGKPKHTFEVDEKGRIEVRIRQGDSELIQVFADEGDLAQRKPDLYEKYSKLMSIE